MINLEHLEDERSEAIYEKAELFDFYNKHWDAVIEELRACRDRLQAIELHHELTP